MIKAILDWRKGRKLAVAFVASTREEPIEFVENIATL